MNQKAAVSICFLNRFFIFMYTCMYIYIYIIYNFPLIPIPNTLLKTTQSWLPCVYFVRPFWVSAIQFEVGWLRPRPAFSLAEARSWCQHLHHPFMCDITLNIHNIIFIEDIPDITCLIYIYNIFYSHHLHHRYQHLHEQYCHLHEHYCASPTPMCECEFAVGLQCKSALLSQSDPIPVHACACAQKNRTK